MQFVRITSAFSLDVLIIGYDFGIRRTYIHCHTTSGSFLEFISSILDMRVKFNWRFYDRVITQSKVQFLSKGTDFSFVLCIMLIG